VWWRTAFAESALWKAMMGWFSPSPPTRDLLPHSLLDRFGGDDRDRLVAGLRFLSPITTTSGRSDMAA